MTLAFHVYPAPCRASASFFRLIVLTSGSFSWALPRLPKVLFLTFILAGVIAFDSEHSGSHMLQKRLGLKRSWAFVAGVSCFIQRRGDSRQRTAGCPCW